MGDVSLGNVTSRNAQLPTKGRRRFTHQALRTRVMRARPQPCHGLPKLCSQLLSELAPVLNGPCSSPRKPCTRIAHVSPTNGGKVEISHSQGRGPTEVPHAASRTRNTRTTTQVRLLRPPRPSP